MCRWTHVARFLSRAGLLALFLCGALFSLVASASSAPLPFGFVKGKEGFSLALTEKNGTPAVDASSHPYALSTKFKLNEGTDVEGNAVPAGGDPKDIEVSLPAGLIGYGTQMPRCAAHEGENGNANNAMQFSEICANNTAIGVVFVDLTNLPAGAWAPIYNLVPTPGNAVEFAFEVVGVKVFLHAHLAAGGSGGYHVLTTATDLTQAGQVVGSTVTVWGDPAEAAHDAERGSCEGTGGPTGGSCPAGIPVSEQRAYLRTPSSCEGPLQAGIAMDSWADIGKYVQDTAGLEGMTGCATVPFEGSLTANPSSSETDSPSGLDLTLKLPQKDEPEEITQSDVKNVTFTLPEGLSVNPSAANGLQACTPEQIGLTTPVGASPGTPALFDLAPAACPRASRVGAVEVITPLIDHPLLGSVYVAQPHENPFGSLLALYVVVEDAATGLVVKLPTEIEADQATGRLTARVIEAPQTPFEQFRFKMFEGNRATLATPLGCGPYAADATLAPWSGGAPVDTSASFAVTRAAGGGACTTPGFAPSMSAGVAGTTQAGAYSPLVVRLSRRDGNQTPGKVSVTLPPGSLATLTGVPECGESEANKGTCGSASQIGEVAVAAGAGPEPYWITGGRVYLTGPYQGAPFGLSIVTPTVAGPFTLIGNAGPGKEVVRATIGIDPRTAQATVTSNPLPTIIEGIPLRLKTIQVTIDRSDFTFNPTDCDQQHVAGVLVGGEDATATISSPFQVAGCASLAFKPAFKVSTSGRTSRLDGASLNVKLTYPKGSMGTQANVRYAKVALPKQLPSNLEALKHACPAATFEANPAACDPISRVGTVLVHTQILSVELEGPAYFVSYGGAKFPELVFVLQGDGVTVDLHAETYIDPHTNVTSSTIQSAPDVPIESFELNLPQRPKYAALAAPEGVCDLGNTKTVKRRVRVRSRNGRARTVTRTVKRRVAGGLVMPTTFIAQDGAELIQNTPIEVIGCGKAKQKRKVSRRHARGKR